MQTGESNFYWPSPPPLVSSEKKEMDFTNFNNKSLPLASDGINVSQLVLFTLISSIATYLPVFM